MAHTYFSEKESGSRPRVSEEITEPAWGGILSAITLRIRDGSFGYRYPYTCPDSGAPCGCDEQPFSLALKGEIPDIVWPLHPAVIPPTLAVCDLLEFCFRTVGEPIGKTRHGYYEHYHLRYDHELGCANLRDEINRILSRNGIAYELDADGCVKRLLSPIMGEVLKSAVFQTGDGDLDNLLTAARTKFLDPDLNVRREALEKLWDAWERLKTIEPGRDKKQQVTALLERISPEPTFREMLDGESKELSRI